VSSFTVDKTIEGSAARLWAGMKRAPWSLPLLPLTVLLLALPACRAEEGDLQQHAEACESRCGQAHSECSTDPAFADPWQLSCEVACNFDFNDDSHPFEACIDAAGTCDAKNACVDTGPAFGDGGLTTGPGATTGADDGPAPPAPPADDGAQDTTAGEDTGAGESTGTTFDGPPCCDLTGTSCDDAEVRECTCNHMPECCSGGVWGEVCASIAVANGCISEGCESLEGYTDWSCSCSTIDVWCPEDPFVGQLIFGTDACGLSQGDAVAIANEACEQGNGTCEIGVGSCSCNCTDYGDTCGLEGN
jgi:hypothetical protein